MITGLAHTCFQVSDLDRAIKFYCDALGLKPAFEFRDDDGNLYGIYIHFGARNFIELFLNKDLQNPGPGSFRHVCLEVDDINKTHDELVAKGVKVSTPELGKDFSWQAWICDPDGNSIEL
ncbi:MAG: VOC family protein, partial [Planctomycetes bacterium]|nr:VOC family protein [Planctomycetota bacterium]